MQVVNKECRTCFFRAIDDDGSSYCIVKKKKIKNRIGDVCKNYVEENAWKGDYYDE